MSYASSDANVELFIPPSPSSFKKKAVPSRLEPPKLPDPPYGSVYTPHFSNLPLYSSPYVPYTPFAVPYTPWAPLPQPLPQPIPLLLHRYLCCNPATRIPELTWDVIHPPEFSRVYHAQELLRRWKKPDLSIEAFRPNNDKVWITSNHSVLSHWMQRWGPIVIEGDNVTIGDILEKIYAYLRIPLTHDDFAHLSTVPGNWQNVHQVLATRARDAYELDAVVLNEGFRRVDVLGIHRRFMGLEIVVMHDNSWRLTLSLAPGPVPRLP